MEKIEELKERNYRAVYKKREHRCWERWGEDICVDLYRVRNEDTPRDQIEWVDENEKINNSMITFKEDAPVEKRMADHFKRRVIYEEIERNIYELLTIMLRNTQASVPGRPAV